MAAGFPLKSPLIPDRIPVCLALLFHRMVKCQWGLLLEILSV